MKIKDIILLSCLLFLVGCSSIMYSNVIEYNTLEKYEEYLQRFPNSKYSRKVKSKAEKIEWANIKNSYDVDTFKVFLRKYPNTTHKKTIKKRVERIEWEAVRNSRSIIDIQGFIDTYPKSSYKGKAYSIIKDLKWKRVKNSSSIYDIRAYIKDYPSSKNNEDVRKKLEELEWGEIRYTNELTELLAYKKRYYNSLYLDSVDSRIEFLKWNDIKNSSNIIDYAEFLEEYPHSRYVTEIGEKFDAFNWPNVENPRRYITFILRLPSVRKRPDIIRTIEDMEWEYLTEYKSSSGGMVFGGGWYGALKAVENSFEIQEYRSYLERFPNSKHGTKARSVITNYSKELWLIAKSKDSMYYYEEFLRLFPDSDYSQKAYNRLEYQENNPAKVQIVSPQKVRKNHKGLHQWKTTFKETSRRCGITLRGAPVYFTSKGRWLPKNNWAFKVKLKPGQVVTKTFTSPGYESIKSVRIIWSGKDDWGHEVSIKEFIKIQ